MSCKTPDPSFYPVFVALDAPAVEDKLSDVFSRIFPPPQSLATVHWEKKGPKLETSQGQLYIRCDLIMDEHYWQYSTKVYSSENP